MNETDLAFLTDIFPVEHQRIRFIYDRDGMEATYRWVQRTLLVYRGHILSSKRKRNMAPFYRAEFIRSCMEFRLFLKLYRKSVDLY